jgi:ABC-type glycerol-3-phosphate transport system permease component
MTSTTWRRWSWPVLLAYACVAVLLAYALFPVLWMVSTALKPTPEIRTAEPTFVPSRPTFEHFGLVLGQSNFLTYVRNSLLVATTVTAATLVVSTLAGYAFSRFGRLPGISLAGRRHGPRPDGARGAAGGAALHHDEQPRPAG